jgi:histidine racemase
VTHPGAVLTRRAEPLVAMWPNTTAVDFVKLSPTQNTTVLVRSRHPAWEYRRIAAELLTVGHVHAEQVGFVEAPASVTAQARLHMAGDEFCGNACMALAALTVAERDPGADDPSDVVLEVSGAEGLVTCRVQRQDADYYCRLAMPLPTRIEPSPVPDLGTGRSALVRYPGSVHLVVEADPLDEQTRQRAQAVATRMGETAGVPLVGVMLYDPERRELAPLVNVPALGSVVWERSCGSGMAALGAYLAANVGGPVRTSAHQPGGTMHVEADHDAGGVTGLRIGGRVGIVAEGTAYVHV